jgi:hypothetical protein
MPEIRLPRVHSGTGSARVSSGVSHAPAFLAPLDRFAIRYSKSGEPFVHEDGGSVSGPEPGGARCRLDFIPTWIRKLVGRYNEGGASALSGAVFTEPTRMNCREIARPEGDQDLRRRNPIFGTAVAAHSNACNAGKRRDREAFVGNAVVVGCNVPESSVEMSHLGSGR